jgi:ATP-dependent RNA helicase DDX31/DBP7
MQALLPRVSRQSGTHAVIMAPTRELCIQIYDVLALILRRYHWVVGVPSTKPTTFAVLFQVQQ